MTTAASPARFAVVGTGAISQVAHLPILARMRGAELAGVFDADRAKARTLADRFEVGRVFRSLEEVWSEPEIDAVVIATPNHLHHEQVLAALEAGKYVLCEKPLAMTSEQCAEVLRADGAETRLMVGMNQRFRPDAVALKSFVNGGDLGEVFYLRAGWLNRRIARSRRTWRHRKAGAGGGVLMDLGLQLLDLCLWLLDYPEPRRVSAQVQRQRGTEVEHSAVLLLELGEQCIINLEVTWELVADRERQYVHVLGASGSGALSPLKVFKEMESGLADVTPQLAPGRENQFTASYRQELAYFAEAVRGERELRAPQEHRALLRVLEACYRSAEEAREIHL